MWPSLYRSSRASIGGFNSFTRHRCWHGRDASAHPERAGTDTRLGIGGACSLCVSADWMGRAESYGLVASKHHCDRKGIG